MSGTRLASRRSAVCALVALAAVAACGGVLAACSKMNEPEDPVWGKSACAHCAMVLSDKKYAAQLTMNGERFFFDDVGCLVSWLEKHKGQVLPDMKSWVEDAETLQWVDANGARYSSGAKTPMDFGFESKRGGNASFEDVKKAVAAKQRPK